MDTDWKRFFWRWVGIFAALGLLVPMTLLIRLFLFARSFSGWSVALWPSSLLLAGLDAAWPSPMGAAATLYVLALIINVLLYSGFGLVLWPLADLVRSRVNARIS